MDGELTKFAHEAAEEFLKLGVGPAFVTGMDLGVSSKELYKFLHARMNKSLSVQLSSVKQYHGFELYRQLSDLIDPITSIVDFALLSDIRQMALIRCKNLVETIAQMKRHQNLIDEYREKTGLDVNDEEMAFTVWNYIDPKSSEVLIQRGCSLGKTFFPKVKKDLEDMYKKDEGRRSIQD